MGDQLARVAAATQQSRNSRSVTTLSTVCRQKDVEAFPQRDIGTRALVQDRRRASRRVRQMARYSKIPGAGSRFITERLLQLTRSTEASRHQTKHVEVAVVDHMGELAVLFCEEHQQASGRGNGGNGHVIEGTNEWEVDEAAVTRDLSRRRDLKT